MKKLLTSLFLFLVCASWAQDNDIFSYYFHQNSFNVLKEVKQFDEEKFGKYALKETPKNAVRVASGDWMVINSTGIFLEKNKLMTITKEEVRENSKYNVREGWLHGVLENDSVPCKLEEEMYYFLVPFKTYLYQTATAPNKLIKISKSAYALLSYEDVGYYSVTVVGFTAGGLEMKEVELTMKGDRSISNIENQEVFDDNGDGLKTYVFSPNKQEWNSFIFGKCLITYDSYQKEKPNEE